MDAYVQQRDQVARLYGRKDLPVGDTVAQRWAAADDVIHVELAHVVQIPADKEQCLPREAA